MTTEASAATYPTRLGAYELIRPLAQGGMADIYLARHRSLGGVEREVAVKVLNPSRAGDGEARAMFLHEARVCALLNHQHIAAVLEVAIADGHHYLAMEYVDGADLRAIVAAAARAGQGVPYETAISIVLAAAAGLDHAHRRCDAEGNPLRLVHRDVSLSNIMVGHDGSVKVVDFGIASTTIASVHTLPGVVRGKASYMSPEQCLGDPLDHRTDVFALGVVLYELTTGARCFHGRTDFERMLAVVRGDYLDPSRIVADYPPELEVVIQTALASEPERRYASCAAMIEALEQVLAGRGWAGGPHAIARLMKELVACPPPPAGEPTAPEPAPTPTAREVARDLAREVLREARPRARPASHAEASTQPSVPRLARGSTRRIARGTGAEPYAAFAPAPRPLAPPCDDDDDAPTRGRRAVRRPGAAPSLGAD